MGREAVTSDGYDLSDLLFSNGGEIAIHLPYVELFTKGEAGAIKAAQPKTQDKKDTHAEVCSNDIGIEWCQYSNVRDLGTPKIIVIKI